MLLGIRSLQDINERIVGHNFMEAVFRTRSQLDQCPFAIRTRRWISQSRSVRVSDIRKENYAEGQGNIEARLKTWVDRLSNSETAEYLTHDQYGAPKRIRPTRRIFQEHHHS